MKIKEWYIKTYPNDQLGAKIEDCDFENIFDILDSGKDIYEFLGVRDSCIRERVFARFAEIYGVSPDYIYKKWLGDVFTLKELMKKDDFEKLDTATKIYFENSIYIYYYTDKMHIEDGNLICPDECNVDIVRFFAGLTSYEDFIKEALKKSKKN